jgi:hypothetical protein
MSESGFNLGHLWGPFYRLTRPNGPRVVLHRHKWDEERWVDDVGDIIGKARRCDGCATVRGMRGEEPDA